MDHHTWNWTLETLCFCMSGQFTEVQQRWRCRSLGQRWQTLCSKLCWQMCLPAVCSTASYFQVTLLSSQVSAVRCAALPYVTQSANSLHDKKIRLRRDA